MRGVINNTVQNQAEKQVQHCVDSVDRGIEPVDCLVDFLKEQHTINDQQSRAAIIRMRGWILYAFSRHGIPENALPFILEELESGIDPYTIAAAAKALKKAERQHWLMPYLHKALKNVQYRDDIVCFSKYGAYSTDINESTARDEIERTLAYFEKRQGQTTEVETLERVHCCDNGNTPVDIEAVGKTVEKSCCIQHNSDRLVGSGGEISACRLEDHQGRITTFEAFFSNAPTILVFFYTRCENPHKCPQTMAKLSQLQKAIGEQTIQTAAISYDPKYDNPQRLLAYAQSFGLQTTEQHRLFRTLDSFELVQQYLDLGVGRTGSVVNRHQIEAFVLDARGNVVLAAQRLQWSTQKLLSTALSLLE